MVLMGTGPDLRLANVVPLSRERLSSTFQLSDSCPRRSSAAAAWLEGLLMGGEFGLNAALNVANESLDFG